MYCEKCGKYSGKYPLCKDCYNNENECEICGNNSHGFPLCRECYDKVKEYAEEHFEDLVVLEDDEYEENFESYSPGFCICCGEEKENSEHFLCSKCYKEYRNKELVISLIKAKEIKVHESRYYNKYKCEDGHVVKSKSERAIDNFLNKYKIRHYYEPELSINNDPNYLIHPDFYLPDKNIYIEHWGMDNDEQYKESMSYKLDIYRKLKVTLICTYEHDDIEGLGSALKKKLSNYNPNTINYLEDE